VAKAFRKKALLLPVPVSLMTLAAKLLGKGDVANRLFGSLQVDSSKVSKKVSGLAFKQKGVRSCL